MVTVTTETAN